MWQLPHKHACKAIQFSLGLFLANLNSLYEYFLNKLQLAQGVFVRFAKK